MIYVLYLHKKFKWVIPGEIIFVNPNLILFVR